MDYKTEIYESLKARPFICLPAFENYYHDPDDLGYKPLQKQMVMRVDGVKRVDDDSSIIDFVLTKGGSKLYVGLFKDGFQLSSDDREKIQAHGMPYLWIDERFLRYSADISKSIESGSVQILPKTKELEDVIKKFNATCSVQLTHWFYHSKHGVHYGRKEAAN